MYADREEDREVMTDESEIVERGGRGTVVILELLYYPTLFYYDSAIPSCSPPA
jgi:hypothetical protein